MPIYEYRCTACGAELEKLRKISDPPLVECPECGKETLVKLVSASSFRLKGSGWYETDFKTGKKKNGAGDAGGESASDAAAGAAAGEAKPAGKDGAARSSGDDAGQNKSASKESKAESASVTGKSKDGSGAASKPAPKE